jgi:hypothetical protein
MYEKLEIKPSDKGLAGRKIWLSFFLVLGLLAMFLSMRHAYSITDGYRQVTYVSAGEKTVIYEYVGQEEPNYSNFKIYEKIGIRDFWKIKDHKYMYGDKHSMVIANLISIIALIFVLCSLKGFLNNLYILKTLTVIDKKARTFSEDEYSFPSGKAHQERNFDRLLQVRVDQTSLQRWLDTGSIILEFMVNKNADSEPFEWGLYYISDPYEIARQIKDGLPEYDGLQVRIKKD